jgi:hypothetical protein
MTEKAVALMSKIGYSKLMYRWVGNRGWRNEAKKCNVMDTFWVVRFKFPFKFISLQITCAS